MFDIRQTSGLLSAEKAEKTLIRRRIAEEYSSYLLAEAERRNFSPSERIFVMLVTSGLLRNLDNRLDVATIRAIEDAERALKLASESSKTGGINEAEVMGTIKKFPRLLINTRQAGYTNLCDSVASYIEYYY